MVFRRSSFVVHPRTVFERASGKIRIISPRSSVVERPFRVIGSDVDNLFLFPSSEFDAFAESARTRTTLITREYAVRRRDIIIIIVSSVCEFSMIIRNFTIAKTCTIQYRTMHTHTHKGGSDEGWQTEMCDFYGRGAPACLRASEAILNFRPAIIRSTAVRRVGGGETGRRGLEGGGLRGEGGRERVERENLSAGVFPVVIIFYATRTPLTTGFRKQPFFFFYGL